MTGKCRYCACTDERACPGGCCWVLPDVCSACALEQLEAAGLRVMPMIVAHALVQVEANHEADEMVRMLAELAAGAAAAAGVGSVSVEGGWILEARRPSPDTDPGPAAGDRDAAPLLLLDPAEQPLWQPGDPLY